MTVSANPTPDFQRDQILTAAIGICGLLPDGVEATADQIARAAFHFSNALLDLQSEGVVLITAVRTTLALTSGTSEYDLPTDVIDVELGQDDTIGTLINSAGTAETQVKTMSRGEWMNIAVKTTLTGNPSRCLIDKGMTPLKAVFWPVPNSSLISFRYTKVRLLRDSDTGATTMDLKRTWTPYMMYATAVGVALDNSKVDQAALFKTWADAKLNKCKAGDSNHGSIRFRVGQRGRNW
jgi:hypothetical protein